MVSKMNEFMMSLWIGICYFSGKNGLLESCDLKVWWCILTDKSYKAGTQQLVSQLNPATFELPCDSQDAG